MTDIDPPVIDRQQREAWREAREALALEPGTPDFGTWGPMGRLNGPALQVVLLPSDPLALAVDFDNMLAGELPDRFEGAISRSVQLLDREGSDSSHLLKIATGDANGDRAYLAVARHGGVSVGMAEKHAAYRIGQQRALRLSAVSGAVRLALKAQHKALAALADRGRWTPDGPWELVLALPGATGSLLGAFAPGWSNVEEIDDPPVCLENDPVVRLELAVLPRDDRARDEVLLMALDRTVNTFGTRDPLYLHAHGQAGSVPRDF